MDREEIKSYLPHREPMLLVDKAEMEGDVCVAEYTIREDQFFTRGHFPGNPVVPGVILCEIMAQCSFLLVKDKLEGKLAMFSGLDDVRFKRVVRPGDKVVVHAVKEGEKGPFVIIKAKAMVDGELCCRANMTIALTDK